MPAMVGWTFHGAGWAHPQMEGYVVCAEEAPRLVRAWHQQRMDAERAALADRSERALANWRRLTRHLLLWHSVEAKFQLAKANVTRTSHLFYWDYHKSIKLKSRLDHEEVQRHQQWATTV